MAGVELVMTSVSKAMVRLILVTFSFFEECDNDCYCDE